MKSSYFFIILNFVFSNVLSAQRSLDLGKIPVNISNNYFFKGFEDNRKKENFDFKIIIEGTNKSQNFVIKNGLLSCFTKTSASSQAIIVSIKSLQVFEEMLDSKRIEGNYWLSVEFFSFKENEKIPLTEYNYTSNYKRSNQKVEDIIPIIKNGFDKSFSYFQNWYLKNNLKSEGLTKKVKVVCTHSDIIDADTVAYDKQIKLKWTDFKGKKTGNNNFAAAIFSSFGFTAFAKVENGQIVVTTKIQTYMVPKMSWVSHDAKTGYALAHEQAHFDISYLISEEFKQAIQEKTLSTVDWESEIRYLYLEFFRKLTKIQEKYDLETQHGLNEIKQKEWLLKIENKL